MVLVMTLCDVCAQLTIKVCLVTILFVYERCLNVWFKEFVTYALYHYVILSLSMSFSRSAVHICWYINLYITVKGPTCWFTWLSRNKKSNVIVLKNYLAIHLSRNCLFLAKKMLN